MALRLGLILAILAITMAMATVESSPFHEADWALSRLSSNGGGGLAALNACNGRVGDCIDGDEERMMDSEANRRTLAEGQRFISYAALKKNSVPCNRRGNSYYTNCESRERANPYNRGCSKITHCYRYTNI